MSKKQKVAHWVSEWVSEWQCHLLSCQVTAKKKKIHWPDGAHCDALGYLLQSWRTVFQKYLLSMELGNSIHSFPLIWSPFGVVKIGFGFVIFPISRFVLTFETKMSTCCFGSLTEYWKYRVQHPCSNDIYLPPSLPHIGEQEDITLCWSFLRGEWKS